VHRQSPGRQCARRGRWSAGPLRPQRSKTQGAAADQTNECAEASANDRQRALTWAQRLKRVFTIDIEVCRRCGGRLRVIASIEEPAVIERILEHLGGAGESVDPAHPCRAPPEGNLSL
jgi:hypothetical protein